MSYVAFAFFEKHYPVARSLKKTPGALFRVCQQAFQSLALGYVLNCEEDYRRFVLLCCNFAGVKENGFLSDALKIMFNFVVIDRVVLRKNII